jgi:hypothetical protein
MQELACESYSLGVEDDEAFNSRTAFVANRTSVLPSATSSESRAGVGETASANVEETAAWAERPSATGQDQHGVGVNNFRGVQWNGIGAVTIVLMLSTIFGFQ